MGRHRHLRTDRQFAHRAVWAVALLPLILLLALALGSPRQVGASAEQGGCAGPVAGQHIYDCAHLLSPDEISMLEVQAAAVDRAGAPTVVYLQARNATAQQALQDAIDLMNRWGVESRPGARDGFVMFFDLQPSNLRHGQVALYAGEKHAQHGNLPESELTRIRTDVMTPLLADGRTAEGIAAGLQMVASDLKYGPPPPPAYQTVSAAIGRIPMNILAALYAVVVALLWVRLARRAPMGGEDGMPVSPDVAGNLAPAMAGALVKGRVNDTQIEATILDFARRGMLVMEPTSKDKVRVRLLGDGKGLVGYEHEVWNGLAERADSEHALSSDDLADLRQHWEWAKTLLGRELVERGWYDPEGASARRRPLYIAAALGAVGAAAAIVLMVLSKEGWAGIGLLLFLGAGSAALVRAYLVPNTTVEGELAASSWRAYRETVSARAYEPNLDTDLPYIVALGLVGKLAPRLKAASERGYAPAWFQARGDQYAGQYAGHYAGSFGFYPYWIVFHGSMAPTSSGGSGGGSASGGYSGGGAAGGGGGSAGS
ncbi:MAG: DUF2207 family protein, partial [Ktedonobacterales bacterium]